MSVAHIRAIALNTYREAVRARVVYVLMVAGVIIMAMSVLLSPVALGEGVRITTDIGLMTIDVLGLLIITMLGTTIVYKEIEKRTIMVLLAKPIQRFEFVLGKFIGLAMTLALVVVVETSLLALALLVVAGSVGTGVLWGALMAYVMLLTINAVAVLYTTFAGPMVAAFLTLSTFVAGQLADHMANFALERQIPGLKYFFYLLPNLASMDVRSDVVHGTAIDLPSVSLSILHGLVYAGGALMIAIITFRSRQFR